MSAKSLPVAVAQFTVTEEPERNLEIIDGFARDAAAGGAKLADFAVGTSLSSKVYPRGTLAANTTPAASHTFRFNLGETVELADIFDTVFHLDGVFTMSRTHISPLAEQLGCARVDGPCGAYLHTDETRQTSLPGVFACGDVSLAAGSVALAVAEGVRAGVGAHFSLING